ncbi:MAG TPA: hypothetical protein QF799_06370 [Gammaproteobacteria bacterium]|jgi:hypothetical protein|nr:hypothetical protein [Gammaproteobacteria bacterium]
MNVNKLLQILPASLLMVASVGYAECGRPEVPSVPDGALATEAELAAAQTAVKDYMAGTNVYLECLAQEEADGLESEAPEIAAERIAAHNQAVDDMEVLAEQFNTAVRAWKAQPAE